MRPAKIILASVTAVIVLTSAALAQQAANDEGAVANEGEQAPDSRLPEADAHDGRPSRRRGQDEPGPAAAANGGEQPASPRNVAQVHRLPGRQGPHFETPSQSGQAAGRPGVGKIPEFQVG